MEEVYIQPELKKITLTKDGWNNISQEDGFESNMDDAKHKIFLSLMWNCCVHKFKKILFAKQ